MKKIWRYHSPDVASVERLHRALNCHPVIAAVLANRGILSPTEAKRFLFPSAADLHPPFEMKDMDAAVRRIHQALLRNERILVFGDYDVDGITATAIVQEFLSLAGATVTCYIPDRLTEGYGLKPEHISRFAADDVKLLITVDCGSSSHEAVLAARRAKMDVIVTDHHQAMPPFPDATAMINPNRPDETGPDRALAGVGVAFNLLIALRKYLRDAKFWTRIPEPNLKRFCDLVALGTQADMVPLISDNRVLVKTGLQVLRSADRCGIAALVSAAGLKACDLRASDLAFKLVPRLNAPGRMKSALPALDLLLTQNPEKAKRLARELDLFNSARQADEQTVLQEAVAHIKANPHLLQTRSLVLAKSGWHPGVLGIVASRIVRKYHRPTIVISIENGRSKGSGRSIAGIDLFQVLSGCARDMLYFGGHAMAAGLTIATDRIDAFCSRFEASVSANSLPEHFIPDLAIDCAIRLSDITDRLIDELETLEPFGSGNPAPVFSLENLRIVSSRVLGGRHLQMTLTDDNDKNSRGFRSIWFNANLQKQHLPRIARIACRIGWNRYNQTQTPQLTIVDME